MGAIAPKLAFGVVLFFTLSGFLLYRPFAASILRGEGFPSLRRYLRNRALRIAPAYVAILLLVAIVLGAAVVPAGDGGLASSRLTDPGLLARNVLLVQEYAPDSLLTGITPAWSLAVEVVFYVTLPGLALLGLALARAAGSRRRRRLALLVPPAVLLAIGASGKLVAAHAFPETLNHGWNADWQSVVERSFWCQADLFAFGMTLAVVHADVEDGLIRFTRTGRKLAAGAALLAFVVAAAQLNPAEALGRSFYNTLVALALACFLAVVVLPAGDARPSLLLQALETRMVVWAGLISYSVFLWHEPLVRWLVDRDLTMGGGLGLAVNTVLLILLTAAFATATYRLVELPALRRKAKQPNDRGAPLVPPEQFEAAP